MYHNHIIYQTHFCDKNLWVASPSLFPFMRVWSRVANLVIKLVKLGKCQVYKKNGKRMYMGMYMWVCVYNIVYVQLGGCIQLNSYLRTP